MNSKSLNTIQVIIKIANILSKIALGVLLTGAVGCILVIILTYLGVNVAELTNEIELDDFFTVSGDNSMAMLYLSMGIGCLACLGEAVIAFFASKYFSNELKAGDPFTFEGAKELTRLGIITICAPLAAMTVSSVLFGIASIFTQGSVNFDFDCSVSISTGIAVLILSLICRYGAEIKQQSLILNKTAQNGQAVNDVNYNRNSINTEGK